MFKKISLIILILAALTGTIFYLLFFYNKLPDLIITDYKLANADNEISKRCNSIDPIDCQASSGLFLQLQLTIKNVGNGAAKVKNIWIGGESGGGVSESNKFIILPGQTAILNRMISNNHGSNSFTETINSETRARQIKESNYKNNSILINPTRIY